jgi:hypothetical protein
MLDKLNKIAVKVNQGSGCLFHTGESYDYVLTARHCIASFSSVEDIHAHTKNLTAVKVWKDKVCNISNELTVLDYFLSEDLFIDIAIIIIESVTDAPGVEYKDGRYRQRAVIYGYPKIRATERDPRESLECEVQAYADDEHDFDVRSETPLHTYSNEAIENTMGFSGSGVFELEENSYHLLGIAIRLKNQDASLNKITAVRIKYFNDVLANNTFNNTELKPLIPSFLTSFENYVTELFAFNNSVLTGIFAEQAQSVARAGATPKSVADFLNEKIFIPHSKGVSVNHPTLWKGWIEFLTYLSFDELESKFNNLPQSLIRPDVERPKSYFYYLIEGREWGDVIRYLILKSKKRFKSGSKFFINNNSNPLRPHVLEPEMFEGIVTNIGNAEEDMRLTAKRLQIHQSDISSTYSFVHLQEFSNIFSTHTFTSIRDEEQLKSEIQAALKRILFHEQAS